MGLGQDSRALKSNLAIKKRSYINLETKDINRQQINIINLKFKLKITTMHVFVQ